MELKIKPYHKNTHPLSAILMKGENVLDWMLEIQRMQLDLRDVKAYAIPGTAANSIWGCLLVFTGNKKIQEPGKSEFCQLAYQLLFIPEKSQLLPAVTEAELTKLLMGRQHILHPGFGLVELNEEIIWKDLLDESTIRDPEVKIPEESVFIPSDVHSFQVAPVPPEEILKNIEDSFPASEKLEDKPLSFFEKAKLWFYKKMFVKKGDGKENEKDGKNAGEKQPAPVIEHTPAMGFLSRLMNFFSKQENKMADKMMQDFEELEKRNQKQIDRLMEMLKNNPEEALKYAIPLDLDGSNRGGMEASLDLMKRWGDLSLFSNWQLGSRGGGGSVNLGDHFEELRKQYMKTAEELIKKGEHQKAAFIYMKLLKNNFLAAQTLENGKLFPEAATIYLKYAQNKNKAAECYEKGYMTTEAIELYKELLQNEKVGDLYMKIYRQKEAFEYFEKVVDDYRNKDQFVKASLIYRDKMNNDQKGQGMLMEGWRKQKDAFNCLNNYLNNIDETKKVDSEIQQIYKNDVDELNRSTFLKVIEYEFDKHSDLSEPIRDMAYDIIAKELDKNPGIVNELKVFNKKNKDLSKDTVRFRGGSSTSKKQAED